MGAYVSTRIIQSKNVPATAHVDSNGFVWLFSDDEL